MTMNPTDLQQACDCHLHVFEDGRPLAPTATFKPPHAPVEAYREVQRRLGFGRALVVQPTGYGFDNDCTLQAMAALGGPNGGARGIAVVPPTVSQAELDALHAAGMRGVRFMMLAGGVLPWSALEPIAERIAPLGWTINLQLDGHDLPQHEARLLALPCHVAIDHIGKFLSPVTTESPGFLALRRLLDSGRFWIKLSAPYESSKTGQPAYDDVGALVTALARHYPTRGLWASNWPHPNIRPTPDEGELLHWAQQRVGDDATWRRVLIDNPAELYF